MSAATSQSAMVGASTPNGLGRTWWLLCRRYAWYLIVCLSMLGLLWIVEDLIDGQITQLDNFVYWLVVQHMRRDWLTPMMTTITDLAMPATIIVVLLVIATFTPGWRPAACVTANFVLIVVLNEVLKQLVHRPRPDGYRLVTEVGYSFPSGHAMIAMGFYGLLVWMVWRYEGDRILRWLWSLGFVAVILSVGLSRIYLGVHYASDVLAGYCVSLIWLVIYTRIIAPRFMPPPVNPPLVPPLSPEAIPTGEPSALVSPNLAEPGEALDPRTRSS